MLRLPFIVLSILILPLLISFSEAKSPSMVESFTPQGSVNAPSQVVARFTTPMVPLAAVPTLEPFDISCPVQGRQRWLDAHTWVYDFEKPLPSGIHCSFRLKASLRDLEGNQTLQPPRPFLFDSGGPKVLEVYPYEGLEDIDERQVFLLRLDGPVNRQSVLQRAYCAVSGVGDRIGIKILDDHSLSQILTTLRYDSLYPSDYFLAIQCQRPFPNNTEVYLIWPKSIESPSGLKTQSDQTFTFKTRDLFRARFSCQRESTHSDCIPLQPMSLRFSANVPTEEALKAVIKAPDGKTFKASLVDQAPDDPVVRHIHFKGPFSENTDYVVLIPKGLRDDSGRVLSNQGDFPMKVRTGPYPPLAKFTSRFGIIESKASPAIPITLRNVENPLQGRMLIVRDRGVQRPDDNLEQQIIQWLYRVATTDRKTSLLKPDTPGVRSINIPKPLPAKETEVIGIPVERPGFYVLEVQSIILGTSLLEKGKTLYSATSALVTNLAVHFKKAKDSSLVWVTELQTGRPSSDVSINIRDCKGKILWQGKTDSNGLAMINRSLPDTNQLPVCEMNSAEDTHYDYPQLTALSELSRGLFVFAKKGDDLSFVHTSWNKGIEPWRYNLRVPSDSYNLKVHTVFDRVLLKSSETVHMRHLIRRLTIDGFDMPKPSDFPDTLEIRHIGSDETYELPVRWDQRGSATTDWTIPQEAKLGIYQVGFKKKSDSRSGDIQPYYPSGSFRVEEFKVPQMKAVINTVKQHLINASEAELDIAVAYLSGGPAQNLPARLRYSLSPMEINFTDYAEYDFARGPVTTGLQRMGYYEDKQGEAKRPEVISMDFRLDEKGASRQTIKLPTLKAVQRANVEVEFKDPNGEIQTVSRQVPLYPSSILLGIKPESWSGAFRPIRLQVLALSIQGAPQKDIPVNIELFKKRHFTHRKRIIGGFYSYEHLTEINPLKQVCSGKTDNRGILYCEFETAEEGNLILQAKGMDKEGNPSFTFTEIWVSGKEEHWFELSDSDRIDLLPVKRLYEPGEFASFQVRMPFREATALVTVEREGLLDAQVIKISSKDPNITIPVKKGYAPNVFVSALVVRGRVSDIQPTAMVDLGKPAFKLGIAEIKVGWGHHRLKVDVTPERQRYRVRQQAKVRLKVSAPEGVRLDEAKTVVSVAVVDEGLLELMPNKSWDILQAMMEPRGYQVSTYTAQMHVIGKRHFGMKATASGGGGGRQITRELFDTLLFWNNNVSLDDGGEAEVTFRLNDSVTSFKIAVIAFSDKGLFGSGFATVSTWQDIVVFSGLPKMVREGDQYRAVFTIRNSSEEVKEVVGEAIVDNQRFKIGSLQLMPAESMELGWYVVAPKDADRQSWTLRVGSTNTDAEDTIRIAQKIRRLHEVRTVHQELHRLDRPLRFYIQRPEGMIRGRGGLELTLSRSILRSIDSAADYMNQYPYTCLEQRVSRAVALMDRQLWGAIVREIPNYLDDHGLLKYFPTMPKGSDVLTAYVLSISHEASFELPDYILQRMQEGLVGFINGKLKGHSPLQTSDYTIRRLSALEALSRYGLADTEAIASLRLDPKTLPTSALIDWINLIRRVGNISNRDKRYVEAVTNLTSRFVYHGTTASLTTEQKDHLWWLMASPDQNLIRTALTFMGDREWKTYMPQLIRGILARQRGGLWDSTTANAWGVIALKRFASLYESEFITGNTSVVVGRDTKEIQWKANSEPSPLLLRWEGLSAKELNVSHRGGGYPWLILRSLAAVPLSSPVYKGYSITKSYTPIEQRQKGRYSVGDILKVRLDITATSDMAWVVVKDPIPAGAVIMAKGLVKEKATSDDMAYPVFEERASDSYRAYFDYLPKGKVSVEYLIRLNTAGSFNMPETRVEALYQNELYGALPNQRIVVAE